MWAYEHLLNPVLRRRGVRQRFREAGSVPSLAHVHVAASYASRSSTRLHASRSVPTRCQPRQAAEDLSHSARSRDVSTGTRFTGTTSPFIAAARSWATFRAVATR